MAKQKRTSSGAAGPSQERRSKRDRREEARLEREAIRRRAARRRSLRATATAIAVAASVGLVVLLVVTQTGGRGTKDLSRTQRNLLKHAAAAAQAAGCTSVKSIPAYPGDDQQHVSSLPALSTYRSVPPASGPHNPTPLGAGVYSSPPDLGEAIHSLEHGAAEIWYEPAASGSPQLTQLEDALNGEDHVIVAPYDYPGEGGTLPAGRQMALVAWHRLQYCDSVSAPVAVAFVRSYDASVAPDYKGEAPEAGAPI